MKDDFLYSEIIDMHYREPQNVGRIENPDSEIFETNPTCGDTIVIDLVIRNGRIEDIKYVAEGCMISVASASILSEKVKGEKIDEILRMKKSDVLGWLGIRLGPAREKCALISYDALIKAIKKQNK
ncbi:iron-sulfur cluster assembly scaffold protein [Caldiplasma sukawensis]